MQQVVVRQMVFGADGGRVNTVERFVTARIDDGDFVGGDVVEVHEVAPGGVRINEDAGGSAGRKAR